MKINSNYTRVQPVTASSRPRPITREEPRPWDESWGGDCPYRISEVGSRPDQKTSLWQRIGDWYDRIWRPCFEGVGISILFLTVLMGLVFVFVNIGRATGWWGGAW